MVVKERRGVLWGRVGEGVVVGKGRAVAMVPCRRGNEDNRVVEDRTVDDRNSARIVRESMGQRVLPGR